jgi:hypothetical protein
MILIYHSSIYLNESAPASAYNRDTCISTFILALLTIARLLDNPRYYSLIAK